MVLILGLGRGSVSLQRTRRGPPVRRQSSRRAFYVPNVNMLREKTTVWCPDTDATVCDPLLIDRRRRRRCRLRRRRRRRRRRHHFERFGNHSAALFVLGITRCSTTSQSLLRCGKSTAISDESDAYLRCAWQSRISLFIPHSIVRQCGCWRERRFIFPAAHLSLQYTVHIAAPLTT